MAAVETLNYILSKWMLSNWLDQLCEFFAPHQMGVWVPVERVGGSERKRKKYQETERG